MAGIFGDEINNRADFFRELERARSLAAKLAKSFAQDGTLLSVQRQLDYVRGCTAKDRTPTAEERASLDMGLRVTREYEAVDDEELTALRDAVQGVDSYFEHWPEDDLAADPDNLDTIHGFND